MEKQCQLLLSYADNSFAANISLYRSTANTVAEVILSGAPDNKFSMIATVIFDVLTESECSHCVLNINDIDFYENQVVNEFAVGGVVTIITSAIEQGASVAVITDDSIFRNIIHQAFKKHKRCSKVKTFSVQESLSP